MEIVDEVLATTRLYRESTIRTHVVSRMCAQAPRHHAVSYPDLDRVAHALYRRRTHSGLDSPPGGEFADFRAPLSSSSVPADDAGWDEIWQFALTYDGYAAHGDRCLDIGSRWAETYLTERILPRDLDALRTCLFFEQRRYHHMGFDPEGASATYVRRLVRAVREELTLGSSQSGSGLDLA